MLINGKEWRLVPVEPTQEMMARAHRIVRTAIKNGSLVRPDVCSKCGTASLPGADGRATIHAHHHDYSRPLDVEWLCAKCHRAETPLPDRMGAPTFGSRNGQSRLTEQQAVEIRNSPLGCRRLAVIYGVHKTTIQRVRNGTHWNEL